MSGGGYGSIIPDVLAKSIPLCDLPLGVAAHVQSVVAPPAMQRRLAELGIRSGVALSCTQRCAGGGRIVSIGHARLALDRAALQAVVVDLTPGTGV